MNYVVTEQGPLDRRAPGTDVTGVYPAATLVRLVAEGYVVAVEEEEAPAEDAPDVDGEL